MRLSCCFSPTLKEVPAEAQIVSHRLMLRAGLIRQTSAGIYAWLPLGIRVLKNIEQIVREEQNAAGAQEILMPTIQSAELWQQSGRYDAYGKEMLRIQDRHEREMLYGPTNEEMITDIFKSYAKSYRDLPRNLYHIQWKFRDEVRPRFGVMRGREFLMKDAYSFDLDFKGAKISYQKMFLAYLRTYARLGLKAIPMRADSGAIGGDMSHEFIILAETGESGVFCHPDWLKLDPLIETVSYAPEDLEPFFARWTNLYAATDEKHVPGAADIPDASLVSARGIEVGHIFYFGTKYSKPMNAFVTGPGGEKVFLEMGSYGIGVSRLLGAIIEASHDDNGIIWPESVTPYKVGIINLKTGNEKTDKACEDLYTSLNAAGVESFYDDRDESAGVKFADMDLIGLPWQVIVGPRGIEKGMVEIKNRKSGERQELSVESALSRLIGK
jgi:prolyl-tRNA synthetase